MSQLRSKLDRFNKPSEVIYKHLKFVIMDSPSEQNIGQYVKELQRARVTHLVRACEPHYNNKSMEDVGIVCNGLEFPDGDPPSDEIIKKWLAVCKEAFGDIYVSSSKYKEPMSGVAVHCVAGLGRAPVLVAIALIEAGMEAYTAIQFIRAKRRGAINEKQIRFLEEYVPTRKTNGCGCVVQ
eukprot:g3893.t1